MIMSSIPSFKHLYKSGSGPKICILMHKCHGNQWSLNISMDNNALLDSSLFFFPSLLLLLKSCISKIRMNACKVLVWAVLGDMKDPTHVLWVAHKCVKENLISWLWSIDSHWLVISKTGWWTQLLFLPHLPGCWLFPCKTAGIHLERWIFALFHSRWFFLEEPSAGVQKYWSILLCAS